MLIFFDKPIAANRGYFWLLIKTQLYAVAVTLSIYNLPLIALVPIIRVATKDLLRLSLRAFGLWITLKISRLVAVIGSAKVLERSCSKE